MQLAGDWVAASSFVFYSLSISRVKRLKKQSTGKASGCHFARGVQRIDELKSEGKMRELGLSWRRNSNVATKMNAQKKNKAMAKEGGKAASTLAADMP